MELSHIIVFKQQTLVFVIRNSCLDGIKNFGRLRVTNFGDNMKVLQVQTVYLISSEQQMEA